MTDLDLQVVYVNARGQADLLDLYHALILARFLLALGLLKAELAVIHNAANRRLRLGSDLDQIHASLNGDIKRLFCGYDTELLTVVGNQTDFFVADLFVDLMFHAANSECTSYGVKTKG